MAKKKEKPQVINNIQELNLEIDYAKLAEAIIKAQQKSKSSNHTIMQKNISRKTHFWKSIYNILRNSEPLHHSEILPTSIATLIQHLFNMLALTLLLISPAALCFGGRRIYDWIIGTETDVMQNIVFIIMCFFVFFTNCLMSIIMRGIANEIVREKDKHYIISVFSGIVSFAALIVALIALFKGVG